MCHMSHVTFFLLLASFFDKVLKLFGGGSVINVAYPVYLEQMEAGGEY